MWSGIDPYPMRVTKTVMTPEMLSKFTGAEGKIIDTRNPVETLDIT